MTPAAILAATRGAIIVDIENTVALWRRADMSPQTSWRALTGQYRKHVTWKHVKDFMIGWELTYRQMTKVKLAA